MWIALDTSEPVTINRPLRQAGDAGQATTMEAREGAAAWD